MGSGRVAGPHGRTAGTGAGGVEHTGSTQVTGSVGVGEPRRVAAYAVVLLLVALGAGVALLAAGAALPPPGPLLLLALIAALCVNRFALFPTEHASTAEAAVLLAAVVGFRDQAPSLGPLAVALLVGPLDVAHWERRSFVRMMYNSGNRGLSTLAAAGACAGSQAALGTGPLDWFLVVVVSGAAFALVDLVLSAGLLARFGERVVDAFRHLLAVDALTLPIAWYGGTVALLLVGIGWWAVALALVPIAFVPELVIARARRDVALVRDLCALVAVGAVLGVLARVLAVPSASTNAVLLALGVLLGVELVLDRRARLPAVISVATVGACVAIGPAHGEFAAVLVTTVSVTVAWCATARAVRPRLFGVVAAALAAAVGAAQLVRLAPSRGLGANLGALGAGAVFGIVAVVTANDRRRAGALVLWTVPLVLAGVGWGWVWRRAGGAVFVGAVVATLGGVVWWGTPPWRSRVLRSATARLPGGALVPVAFLVALAAVTTSALGGVWVPVGLGESLTAMVAIGVRQWRFAPLARARSVVALLAVGGTLLCAEPTLLRQHRPAGVVLLVLLLAVVGVTARVPASSAKAASAR